MGEVNYTHFFISVLPYLDSISFSFKKVKRAGLYFNKISLVASENSSLAFGEVTKRKSAV